MRNTLSEAARPTRLNTNRSEIAKDRLKDQKGTGITANETSQQLAGSGFDSNQIGSVLDKVIGNQLQRPWEDTDGSKPSLENPVKPNPDLKPITDLKPDIDWNTLIDKPAKPISIPDSLVDIIKPAIENPLKPIPGFPFPVKPVGPSFFPKPEVELADPGLTDVHQAHNDKIPEDVTDDIRFQDVDGEVFIDNVGNDGIGAELTDVQQGYVADCYFCSALASIALHNPEYLENMITDNGDGTYTVSFGGELGDVTVDDDFAINQDGDVVYAQMGDGPTPELWVAIIEKAFAQASPGSSYEDIEFGWPHQAIAQITGQDNFTVAQPSAFTPEGLQAALANGQSVTALTPKDPDGDGGKTVTPDGLMFNHAYVVTKVEQNAETGEWEVTVYNPYGHDRTSGDTNGEDGFTVLTLEQFNSNFQYTEVMNEPLG